MIRDIDHIVKNLLASYTLRCTLKGKGCGESFKYEKALEHAKSCLSIVSQYCLLTCGEKTTFKGVEKMKNHLINDCPKMKGTCTKCNTEILRLHVGNH